MKRAKITFGIVLTFLFVGIVFAQPGNQIRNYILERVRERTQERVQISKEEFETIREEARNLILERQQEFRNRLIERGEEVLRLRERNLSELIERLRHIKDQKKQEIIRRTYTRIQALNDNLCNHFLVILEKLELMLERIESRTAKAKIRGLDVTEVEIAIRTAKEKIDNVKNDIESQATKVYSLEFSSEEETKLKVGELRQSFHQDIMVIQGKVKEAFQLVREAAVKLAQIPRVDEIKIENE